MSSPVRVCEPRLAGSPSSAFNSPMIPLLLDVSPMIDRALLVSLTTGEIGRDITAVAERARLEKSPRMSSLHTSTHNGLSAARAEACLCAPRCNLPPTRSHPSSVERRRRGKWLQTAPQEIGCCTEFILHAALAAAVSPPHFSPLTPSHDVHPTLVCDARQLAKLCVVTRARAPGQSGRLFRGISTGPARPCTRTLRHCSSP